MKYLLQRLRVGTMALLALGWSLGVNTTPVAAHDGTPLSPHTLMRMWDWESWSMVAGVKRNAPP